MTTRVQSLGVVCSRSIAETESIAGVLARYLVAGDIIVLTGELGGGKTAFVRGATRALGSDDLVTSPTFAIVQEYDALIKIVHIDCYRIDRVQELHDIGFSEMLDDGSIAFIEWGELATPELPSTFMTIVFTLGAEESDRSIAFEVHGDWSGRCAEIESALEHWRNGPRHDC